MFNLNPSQQQLANHHAGPLLAVAVAGSGKTTALIANLYNKHHQERIDLTRVLVTAFNKEAAEQLKRRVIKFYPGVDLCPIGTSHSLFYRMLRDAGLKHTGKIYKEYDATVVLREVIGKRYTNGEEGPVYRAIGYLKNHLAYPKPITNTHCYDTYQAMAQQVADNCEVDLAHLTEAYLAYEQDKESKQAIDMDDMLFRAYVLFVQHPGWLTTFQSRFDHLIVDEYQDTNEVQYQLFRMLACAHDNIIVVGDDDQAIYSFRGSYPKYIQRFQQDYPNAPLITMDLNYRSQEGIIRVANPVIARNKDRFDKALVSTKPFEVQPYFVEHPDFATEADWIAKTIDQGHLPHNEIAILMRVNLQQALLEQALAHRNIPYRVADGTSFFAKKEIITLLQYLKLAYLGPKQCPLLVRDLANKPYRKFSAKDIGSLLTWNDWLAYAQHDTRAAQYVASLEMLHAQAQTVETRVDLLFEFILNRPIQLAKWYNRNASLSAETKPSDVLKHLARINEGKPLSEVIQSVENVQAFYQRMNTQPQRVTLSTIHRAKGLEWTEVYIPGCHDELFPHKHADSIEEERRLFYVAMTRAKQYLILSTVTEHGRSPFVSSVLDWLDYDNDEDDFDELTPTPSRTVSGPG